MRLISFQLFLSHFGRCCFLTCSLFDLCAVQYLEMFYFYQNDDSTFDWEQAYRLFVNNYTKLTEDCSKATILGDSLRLKIEMLTKQNQQLRAKKIAKELAIEMNPISQLSFAPADLEKVETVKSQKSMRRLVRKQNSNSNSNESRKEEGSYECTYPGCGRNYGSSVSMNLHIKIKHNGGTKKEREAYAKVLLDAEEKGEEPPQSQINLPPNFIEVNMQ